MGGEHVSGDGSGGDPGGADGAGGRVASLTLGASPVWAHFTNPPAFGGTDATILTEFARLVRDAPATSAIRCAIHSISHLEPADALVDARDRGVDVRVVVDGNVAVSTADGARRLRDLGRAVRFCTGNRGGGCVTTNVGNMHAKFLTMGETTEPDGVARRDVSWFGSSNLTDPSGTKSFNNAITVYEDPALRAGFDAYFDELWSQNHYPSNDFYSAAAGRGYYRGATATIFASPEANTDLVYSRLNDLTPGPSCSIRVAQSQFTDGRTRLADLLVAHKRRGCDVRVAVGLRPDHRPAIGAIVRARLAGAGIPIRKHHVHSKVVVLAAQFGEQFHHRVYTGSHNWTHSANYDNDEVFVRMAAETEISHPLYDAFHGHFNDAYDAGSPV